MLHNTTLKVLMALTWLLPLTNMIVIQIYIAANYSIASKFIPTSCSCIMSSDMTSTSFLVISLFIPILAFMLFPLIFNITAYTCILVQMFKSSVRARRRHHFTYSIAMRALTITLINILSWVPFVVLSHAMEDTTDLIEKRLSLMFLYINCITDPILYTSSCYIIQMCKKGPRHRLHTRAVAGNRSTPLSFEENCFSTVVVNSANIMSSSGMHFDAELLDITFNKSKSIPYSPQL